MAIRLWPQDFERKEHITKAEKALLRYASRNFQNGHMVIGIDPLGLSTDKVKLGMYISPSEGLLTFSIYTGKINTMLISSYLSYVEMVEEKIYKRLLDSKLLIVRNGQNKALKFPYKHIIVFADETAGRTTVAQQELNKLLHYATLESFRPITSMSDAVKEIGIQAFYHCTALSLVSLSTSLSRLETSTFAHCTSLESIDIPDSIKTIECYAFGGCNKLKEIGVSYSSTKIVEKALGVKLIRNGDKWLIEHLAPSVNWADGLPF